MKQTIHAKHKKCSLCQISFPALPIRRVINYLSAREHGDKTKQNFPLKLSIQQIAFQVQTVPSFLVL